MKSIKKKDLQLWSLEAAANELKCNVSTLRTYAKAGELDLYWIGGKYMIENDELLKFIESRKDVIAPCGLKKKIVGRRPRLARGEDQPQSGPYAEAHA